MDPAAYPAELIVLFVLGIFLSLQYALDSFQIIGARTRAQQMRLSHRLLFGLLAKPVVQKVFIGQICNAWKIFVHCAICRHPRD